MTKNRSTSGPKWAQGLDHLETQFVREYLVDLNATRAYQRIPGVTDAERSCGELGHRMLKRPHVARAIDDAMAADGSGPRQWLVRKLHAIAAANLDDFFTVGPDGKIALAKPWDEIPRSAKAMIREMRNTPDGLRITLHDPIRAMELLAKAGSIGLTKERLVVEDAESAATPDIELARRVAFLLQRAAQS